MQCFKYRLESFLFKFDFCQVCLPAMSLTLEGSMHSCPALVAPTCGEHQELRTIQDAEGCPKLVCGESFLTTPGAQRCYVYSSHYNSLAQHVVPQFISSLNFLFKNSCHPRTTSPKSSLHPSLILFQNSCHPRSSRPKVHVILASGSKIHVIPQQEALGITCYGMT
jgi:hypothetical protein